MRKLMALLLAALLLMAGVGAFAEGDPIVITFGKQFDFDGKTFPEGQDLENNYYCDYLMAKHNVKVEYEWVLDDGTQKESLAVANGDMPDVMMVDLATFNMLVESDMLAPLTEVFDKYANQYLRDAASIYSDAFKAASVGGELMAIPNTVPLKQHVYTWVRQDWLNKLGLSLPTTTEDIVAIAKAFIEQDPDGNGEKDTIGLTLNSDYIMGQYGTDHTADPIANLMGAYARMWYEQEDGTVIYGSITPETRNALEYLAKLYKEGIIDPQFAVRDQAEQVISGKCGIFFGSWCAGPLRQSYGYDGADWVPVAAPLAEDGTFYTTSPVPANTYLVVSKECKNPEAAIWALGDCYEFHRMLIDDEEWLAKIKEYQILGVSWNVMPLDIQLEAEDIVATRGRDMKQMVDTGDRTGISLQNQSFYDAYLAWLDDNTSLTGWVRYKGMYLGCNVGNYEKNNYTKPVFWGTTETMVDYWTNLTSMEDEVFAKIVMGESDITAFDQFVSDWNAQGGATITAEVQEYVNARK